MPAVIALMTALRPAHPRQVERRRARRRGCTGRVSEGDGDRRPATAIEGRGRGRRSPPRPLTGHAAAELPAARAGCEVGVTGRSFAPPSRLRGDAGALF